MGAVRDDLIRRSAPSRRADLQAELEALGPTRLWCQFVRGLLFDHGFVQTERESFAETLARALSISTDDLRVLISDGLIAAALLQRFGIHP